MITVGQTAEVPRVVGSCKVGLSEEFACKYIGSPRTGSYPGLRV